MSKTKKSPFSYIYLHSPPKIFIHNKINNSWQLLSKNWNCIRLSSNRARVWIFVTKYMNLCWSLYIFSAKYSAQWTKNWEFVCWHCLVLEQFDTPCKIRVRLSIDWASWACWQNVNKGKNSFCGPVPKKPWPGNSTYYRGILKFLNPSIFENLRFHRKFCEMATTA